MRTTRTLLCALAFTAMLAGPADSGSRLEGFDFTGDHPSPIPGQVLGLSNAVRLDDRCIPMHFRLNTTLDPIPNGAGAPHLSLAQASDGIRQAMGSWNDIPTSYVEMHLTGTTQSPVHPALDFVNEVSFLWPPGVDAVGLTRFVSLIRDTLFSHGDDLDGDGDADVSSAILACEDVDGDGDIEFPAGSYRAGTMLDVDIMFNTALNFTVDGSVDAGMTWDLVGVAAHELGHALGLDHSGIVQKSPTDGTAQTMYGAFRDGPDRLALRNLHTDELAWSSFLYPEGSRKDGPAALQKGDIAFEQRYSVISGEVRDAARQPVAGAVVFAEDPHGRVVASAISGRVRASFPLTQLLPPELGIVHGRYALPVPKGVYRLGIEPNDGFPLPDFGSNAGLFGFFYGSQNFTEEYFNGGAEDESEPRLGAADPVVALHDRKGVDFRLEDNRQLFTFNADDLFAPLEIGPQGILLAVRIPRADVLAVDRGRGILVQAASFGTFPQDTSDVAVFDAAMITTGRIAADGSATIDLRHPLALKAPFVGQDADLTPLYVDHAWLLGLYARSVLPALDRDFFVVLAVPKDEYPGWPGFSKYGVLVDLIDKPDGGTSYFSKDGGKSWVRQGFSIEYSFGLVVAPR